MTILTYPDGDYQFVAPAVLKAGDTVRIHTTFPGNLSTTSEPVTFVESFQTKDLLIVETTHDSKEHQIPLHDRVAILRRNPTLPTEDGATIFIDDLVEKEWDIEFIPGALAIYSKMDDLWNWFYQRDWTHCEAPSANIKAWRPAYVTDKAPECK